MSNKLQIFESTDFGTVRTVLIDKEPYFVGKDVAEILGYTNPQKAIRDHVDDEDRTVNESFTVNGTTESVLLIGAPTPMISQRQKQKTHTAKHEEAPQV